MRAIVCWLTVATVALGLAAPAMAAPVSLPTGYEVMNWDGVNVQSGAGTFTSSVAAANTFGISQYTRFYSGGTASAVIRANGQYAAAATDITYSNLNVADSAGATIQYYITITGPTASVLVDVGASGEASGLTCCFANSAYFRL
jgi:hypothetical protein